MLFSKKTIIMAIVLTGMFVSSSFAANLDVCPSGCAYSSIQAAINAASDGDTIRVAQGIYFENISITDPINITIEGGWNSTFTGKSHDSSLTVVNGMGLDNVFYIYADTDETISVTIEGLTITNGGGPYDGGGVYARARTASSSTTDSNLNLTIRNNRIVGNRASQGGGGGIYIYANTNSDIGRAIVHLDLSNNRIVENSTCCSGGGIYIYGYSSTSYSKKSAIRFNIECNEINGNYAAKSGGGCYINLYRTDYEHSGSSSIEANEINGNESFWVSGLYMDLDNCSTAVLEILNNVISGNFSQNDVGGIYIDSYLSQATIKLTNNTITKNAGFGLEACSDGYGGTPDNLVLNIYNNIIYGNDTGWLASDEIYLDNYSDGNMVVNLGSNILSTVDVNDVTYNDMGGNLGTDPLIGGDFHLCAGSPAINTADASKAPPTDHDGHARAAAPLPDMGAYEYLGSDHQAEMPVPSESFQKDYPSIPLPVVASDESVARPFIAYIDQSAKKMRTRIALPNFSAPVDVYIGFLFPYLDPGNIYQIANDLSCKTMAAYGPVKWQSGITGAVESSLYGDLPLTALARAEYIFYMIIVPAGGSPMGPKYYYYRTSVIID